MKILVLSHTRSGSTTLCKWISNELDIELDETPYDAKKFNLVFEKTNIIRKIVIEEYLPSNDIINKFDKVICLTRQNSIDTAISFIVANKKNIWHNEYVVSTEWISKHSFEITDISRRYDVMKNYLKKINGLHITYEEIYIKNNITHLLKYFDITDMRFLDMLSSNKKYRKDKNSPINYDKPKNFI